MSEFYKKLVDLYAGGELTEELADEMDHEAMRDPQLAQDMYTLKRTVELVQSLPEPEYTEESDLRIHLRMQILGAEVQRRSPEPSHWQYHLPIQS